MINRIIKEEIDKLIHTDYDISFETLYHGTDYQSGIDIINNGINVDKLEKGYFGKGFYTTHKFSLAKSNYGDFADPDLGGGIILEFKLDNNANIIDMRDDSDSQLFNKFSNYMHSDNFINIMQRNGIDGLFDRSFDGVVIYNPDVLTYNKSYKLD